MDVDMTIRYSDNRLCEVVVFQPNDGMPLYQIVTRRADLGPSLSDAMPEARRLYYATPWPDGGVATTLRSLGPNFPEHRFGESDIAERKSQDPLIDRTTIKIPTSPVPDEKPHAP